MNAPNYHCPVCGTLSEMVIGPEQAFCTNRETCDVLTFNPSLPDGGMSDPHVLELFTCPRCHLISSNPNDVREGYCGHCHDWTREGLKEDRTNDT